MKFKIIFALVILMIGYVFYGLSNHYPLEKKPDNFILAYFLLKTIANNAKCSQFEFMIEEGYYSASCMRNGNGHFSIYGYDNNSEKERIIKKIIDQGFDFKYGKYHLVTANHYYGSTKTKKPIVPDEKSLDAFYGQRMNK